MKQLTCEMCGSTDLVKQEGFFVCQTCGCKYSVEEAKKMMIEGTVEVQGTVKVDNSDQIEKYLENARRAKKKQDWEETEKYYNLVEQNSPGNIEAIFYSSFAKARILLIETDYYKREHAFKVLCNTVSIIDENYKSEDDDFVTIYNISDDINAITSSDFIYKIIDEDKVKLTYGLFSELHVAWMKTLLNIAQKSSRDSDKEWIYRKILYHYESSCNFDDDAGRERSDKAKGIYKSAHKWLYQNDNKYKEREIQKMQEEIVKIDEEMESISDQIKEVQQSREKNNKVKNPRIVKRVLLGLAFACLIGEFIYIFSSCEKMLSGGISYKNYLLIGGAFIVGAIVLTTASGKIEIAEGNDYHLRSQLSELEETMSKKQKRKQNLLDEIKRIQLGENEAQ